MVMVEEYPCANHLEACRREDECMRELKATMNSCGAVFDKEKIGLQEAIYEANKETLSEKISNIFKE
jgi:hypothetical protein